MTVTLNKGQWKDLPTQSLDSLWLFSNKTDDLPWRDLDLPDFHGAFVPQVPYYLMRRFAVPGDKVWDVMAGSLTAHRVGDRLGLNVTSTDLVNHLEKDDPYHDKVRIMDVRNEVPAETFQLVIWHPPYRQIIQFSDDVCDMSSMDEDAFWSSARDVLHNINSVLETGRVAAILLGDIYENKAVVPLAAIMYQTIEHWLDWRLKAWVVKDIQNHRPQKTQLMRYRSSRADSVRFMHEHLLWFIKDS